MDEEYSKEGEIYKKMFNKESKRNQVTIASRRPEIYIETILRRLQNNDQVELCCLDRYLDRAIEIIHLFGTIGIVPERGKLIFEKAEEDLINRTTGKINRKPVNRITLTKIPELFRFTEI